MDNNSYNNLYRKIETLYAEGENKSKLLFHGWHHIKFVHDKAIEFAKEIGADENLVAVAALVHDINYIYTEDLDPAAAEVESRGILSQLDEEEIDEIIEVVNTAHTANREGQNLSKEAMALSDADTLFKALPITPILFASNFIRQNKIDIKKLSEKIVSEQGPLMESGQYFYTRTAKDNYMAWAETNLEMWKNVKESLEDDSIRQMLAIAEENGVLDS
ncbi:MAG: HD domain-containing protein [Candidatus Dojkabacteria bacterium]